MNYLKHSFSLLFITVFIIGCSSKPKMPALSDDEYRVIVNDAVAIGKDSLQYRDALGRTLLHLAIQYDSPHASTLMMQSQLINEQDIDGYTPLHYAVMYKPSFIRELLFQSPDRSLLTHSFTWCKKGRSAKRGKTAYGLARSCRFKVARKAFDDFDRDAETWQLANAENSVRSYRKYLAAFKEPLYADKAKALLEGLYAQRLSELKSKKVCSLKAKEWYLIQGDCRNGLAHGSGHAESIEGDSFTGQFQNGLLSYGKYYSSAKQIFDGPLENGEFHGEGVCLFEGLYEECRMYQGQRIDELFKLREIANSKQAVVPRRPERSGKSLLDYDYVEDLNSSNEVRRTVARAKAVRDLYNLVK